MHRILLALVLAHVLFVPSFAQEQPAAPGVTHSPAQTSASFTLRTGISQCCMVFIGSGGGIDGHVNRTGHGA